MNEPSHAEEDILIKKLVRYYMEDQLNELKSGNQDKNKSFVFLENKTLNLLLFSLLTNLDKSTPNSSRTATDDTACLAALDELFESTKHRYEEIMGLFK
ncbi:hypothetical protein MUN89_04530 [Halobacillus salinarum]|uniref:Uncharacterized protein n=1 Tax=Halobacillus salinarum TaxID=2932257 RepID=A0ABY4EL82_9BACI|nr:hypothetical protein [Halobacillus salinarum]UOQ45220.1 hypothetical protein MUN89_04530 [Halobacillus salinarum]